MSLRADRPHASTAINPDLQVRAPERSDRGGTSTGADHFLAQSRLWGALHERLGRSGVSQLLSEGPATAFDLQILHVAGFVESTGIDATTYLPWNAPLAWQGRTQPYYQVLLQSLQAQNQAVPGVDASSSNVSMSGDNLDSLGTWESVGLGWSGALDTGLGLEASGPDAAGLDVGLSGGVDTGAVTAGMDSAGVGGFDVGAAVSREAEGEAPTGNQAFTQWFGEKLVASGTGRGLTSEESAFLQEIHGQSFSQVRVHEGPGAKEASQAIAARAFTLGNDIFLGEGGDLMANAESASLLAHEVTHVVQGGQGRLPGSKGEGLSVSSPSQPHEREAEAVGRMAQAVFDTFQQLGPDGEATPGWGLDASWDMDPVGAALASQLSAVLPTPGLAAEDQVRGLLKSDRSRAGRESVTSQHVLLDVAEALGEDADVVGGLRGVLGQAEASLQGDRSLGELVDLTGAPTEGELGNLSIQDPTPGVVDLASTVTADLTDDTAGPALLGGDGLSGMLFSGGAGADLGADMGAGADGGAVARKATSGDAGVEDGASDSMDRALQTRGQGMSLPQDLQARLEARLGVNLSGVRLHTDARAAESADAVRAEAFTVGQDIYFNAGNFNPYSPEGVELISHEVTHAAQFLQGRDGAASSVEGGVGVTKPGDAVEQEAEAVGAEMAAEHVGSGAGDVAGETDAGLDAGLSVEGAEVSAGDSGDGAAVSGEGAQDGLDTQGTPDAVGADGGDVAARSALGGVTGALGKGRRALSRVSSGGDNGPLGLLSSAGSKIASAVPGLDVAMPLIESAIENKGMPDLKALGGPALQALSKNVPGLNVAMPIIESLMNNQGLPSLSELGGPLMNTIGTAIPGLGAAMPLIQTFIDNKGAPGLKDIGGALVSGLANAVPGLGVALPLVQGLLSNQEGGVSGLLSGASGLLGGASEALTGAGGLLTGAGSLLGSAGGLLSAGKGLLDGMGQLAPGISGVTSMLGGMGANKGGLSGLLGSASGLVESLGSSVPGLSDMVGLLGGQDSNKGGLTGLLGGAGGLLENVASGVLPGLGGLFGGDNKGGLPSGGGLASLASGIPGLGQVLPLLQAGGQQMGQGDGGGQGSESSFLGTLGLPGQFAMAAQSIPGITDLVKVVEGGLSNIAGPNQGLGRGSLAEGGDTVGWIMQAVPGLPQLVSTLRGGLAEQVGTGSGNPAGNTSSTAGKQGVGATDRMMGFNMNQLVSAGVNQVGGPTAGAAAQGSSPMGRGAIDVLDTAIPGLSEFTNVLNNASSMMGGNPVDYASMGGHQSLGSERGGKSAGGGQQGPSGLLGGAGQMLGGMANKVGKGLLGGLF